MVRRNCNILLLFSCLSILVSSMCYLSCQRSNPAANDTPFHGETELPKDFIAFYQSFHADSSYQMSHIVFPLSGIAQDTAGRDSAIVWLPETWKLQHLVAPDDNWSIDFTIPRKGVVQEFIYAKNEGFWLERRYAKLGGQWMLIYYSGLQQNAGRKID